jgi:hypothetical protein
MEAQLAACHHNATILQNKLTSSGVFLEPHILVERSEQKEKITL